MIITTTPTIEGRRIIEYKSIVFGEIITGTNLLKDIGASLKNIFGGRAEGYEDELIKARENVLAEIKQRAHEIGANAVIGVKIDYESLGSDNTILMVTCYGTAVVIA